MSRNRDSERISWASARLRSLASLAVMTTPRTSSSSRRSRASTSNQRYSPSPWIIRTSTEDRPLVCALRRRGQQPADVQAIVFDDELRQGPAEHRLLLTAQQAAHGRAGEGDAAIVVEDHHDVRRVLDQGPEASVAPPLVGLLGEVEAIERQRELAAERLERGDLLASDEPGRGDAPGTGAGPDGSGTATTADEDRRLVEIRTTTVIANEGSISKVTVRPAALDVVEQRDRRRIG